MCKRRHPTVGQVAERYLRYLEANPAEFGRLVATLGFLSVAAVGIFAVGAHALWTGARDRLNNSLVSPLDPPAIAADRGVANFRLAGQTVEGVLPATSDQPQVDAAPRTTLTERHTTRTEVVIEKFTPSIAAGNERPNPGSVPAAVEATTTDVTPPKLVSPDRKEEKFVLEKPALPMRNPVDGPENKPPVAPLQAGNFGPSVKSHPDTSSASVSAAAGSIEPFSTSRRWSPGRERQLLEEQARIERIERLRARNDRSLELAVQVAERNRLERFEQDRQYAERIDRREGTIHWPDLLANRFAAQVAELEQAFGEQQFDGVVGKCDALLCSLKMDLQRHGLARWSTSNYTETRQFVQWVRTRAAQEAAVSP